MSIYTSFSCIAPRLTTIQSSWLDAIGMIPAVAPPFGMTRWSPQTRKNCKLPHLNYTRYIRFPSNINYIRCFDVPIQPNGYKASRLHRYPPTSHLDGYVPFSISLLRFSLSLQILYISLTACLQYKMKQVNPAP